MCNKDDLVSYLYDDLDGPARGAFERHLRDCVECRDELKAMRAVRADMLTWSPPEPDFAFRIVAEPRAATARGASVPAWRAWFSPAFGLAAAAVLVLAAAAGLARVEVHRDANGWTLRTGASAPASQGAFAGFGGVRARDVNLAADSGEDVMAALERRIGALEAAARGAANLRAASAQSARASDAEMLKVVRDLLAQSETRQKSELALRIAQVIRDVDAQRVADLNRVQMGLGRIDANVAEEAQAHRELMNYILTNSKQK